MLARGPFGRIGLGHENSDFVCVNFVSESTCKRSEAEKLDNPIPSEPDDDQVQRADIDCIGCNECC